MNKNISKITESENEVLSRIISHILAVGYEALSEEDKILRNELLEKKYPGGKTIGGIYCPHTP